MLVPVDPYCHAYSGSLETELHALINCKAAAEVWKSFLPLNDLLAFFDEIDSLRWPDWNLSQTWEDPSLGISWFSLFRIICYWI